MADEDVELAPERPPGTTEELPITIVLEVRADATPEEVAAHAVDAFTAALPQTHPAIETEEPATGTGWGIGSTTEVGVPGIRVFDETQPTEAPPAPPSENTE